MSNLSIKHLNVKKSIFKVNKSSLENRWDPQQFHIERAEELFKLSRCSTTKLKNLFYFKSFQVTESDKTYVGLENIESETGVYIGLNEKITFSSAKKFKKGNVLFPKLRPYLNKVYLAEFNGVCSTEFYVLDSKSEIINEFLAIYLRSNLIVNQTKHLMTGNTLPRLQTEDVNSLQVPNISYHLQELIVEKHKVAINLRKIKLAEVKEKLSLIDAYLLEKLGVEHKQKKLNVESRIFTMPFRNLVGKRFDPIFYNSDLDQFNKGKFTSIKLKTLIIEFSSGQGVGRQDQASEEEGVLQIRPTNLGPQGSFVFEKNVFVPDEARHKRLQKGDVIFNNTNSQELVGKSAYWDVDLEATYSNHITVLRVDETKILPEYLALILNLYQKSNIFYSICTNWNNQSGVGIDVLLDLNIPLPPLTLQEELILHIRQIRNEATKLETEANLVLEKAKQEIEKLILGEEE